MKSHRILPLLLLLATLGPFLGVLGHGFLNWDDPEYIPGNPLIRDGAGLLRIWTSFDNPQVYPMVFTSYWLEYHLWGLRPAGYHAVNLLLHALTVLLLFRFLLRLRLGRPLAFACALLFAVHPTQVASVAWLSERKNVLSGVFYFLCLGEYLAALRGAGRWRLFGSWLLAALAMLSKTTTVTLPLTAALLEWWVRREPGDRRTEGAPPGGTGFRGAGLRLLPIALLALLLSALTVFREHGPEVVSDIPLFQRICIAGCTLWFHAGKLLLPIHLCGVYPRWAPASMVVPGLLAWAGALGLGLALWRLRRRLPRELPFGLTQYVAASLPTCGILSFGYLEKSLVADHFLYLPSWGFWVALFGLLGWVGRARAGGSSRWVTIPAVVVALAFVPLTVRYARSWRDPLTFWNQVLRRDPHSWLAHGNRGQWYATEGDLEPALADFRRAIQLKPDYVEAHFNLGYVLDRLGRTADAEDAYKETLRLSPTDPDAHNNLGVLYLRAGDLPAARREFEAVLELLPDDPGARRNLRQLEERERLAGTPRR